MVPPMMSVMNAICRTHPTFSSNRSQERRRGYATTPHPRVDPVGDLDVTLDRKACNRADERPVGFDRSVEDVRVRSNTVIVRVEGGPLSKRGLGKGCHRDGLWVVEPAEQEIPVFVLTDSESDDCIHVARLRAFVVSRPCSGEEPARPRKLALVLGLAAGVFWLLALALPIYLVVLTVNLPGEDPTRPERSLVIASGAFLSLALLATPATIGFFVVRRAGVRSSSAGADST